MDYKGKVAIVANGEVPIAIKNMSEQKGIPIFDDEQYFPGFEPYRVILACVPGQKDVQGAREAESFIACLKSDGKPIILLTNNSTIKQAGSKKPCWPTRRVSEEVDEVILENFMQGENSLAQHALSAIKEHLA